MEVSDLHRSLGLESRTPHTLLSTDAGEKVYPSVCPLRSLLRWIQWRGQFREDAQSAPKTLSPIWKAHEACRLHANEVPKAVRQGSVA